MRRPDGSIRSHNNPVWENRYQERDNGLYFGIVVETQTPGLNISATSANEMTYTVRLIGSERDGQLVFNCRIVRPLGGRQNFYDRTLKQATEITGLDIANELNPTLVGSENGDYVYIQFLNGETSLPIIVGLGKSPIDGQAELPETQPFGQHLISKFNGVETKINENGDFSWTKDVGAFLPLNLLNSPPALNEYASVVPEIFTFTATTTVTPLAAQLQLQSATGIGLTIDAIADSYNLFTATGTELSIEGGPTDAITLQTVAGANISVSGIQDSFTFGTSVGTALNINGLEDSLGFVTAGGAGISISGLTDEVGLTTTSGAGLTINPTSISMVNAAGGKLELPTAGLSLLDATGAGLEVSAAGFIKLGNASADLIDIIDQLITSLSTATYAGFGSSGSNLTDLVQLVTQIKLLKGG